MFPSSPVSSSQFWFFTFGLIIVWTIVIATASPSNVGTKTALKLPTNEKEIKNGRNCKALCEHCGCLGFYCGEECICECNNDNSDTECIATMQNNARKLNIPFELLIQGPSSNRFVRNALQFEQNADEKAAGSKAAIVSNNNYVGRNKRSTVVIYKPSKQNSLLYNQQNPKSEIGKKAAKNVNRHKRSVKQLEWFSDLANTLVRPAPLGGAKRFEEPAPVEDATKSEKHYSDDVDRPWFAENTNSLLQPSPLFKRNGVNNRDEAIESPVMTVAKGIPQTIKDTIRNLRESAVNDDLVKSYQLKFPTAGEILAFEPRKHFEIWNKMPKEKPDNIYDHMKSAYEPPISSMDDSTDIRDQYPDENSKMALFRNNRELPKIIPSNLIAEDRAKYLIPWFRPARFLQRVQQAIK